MFSRDDIHIVCLVKGTSLFWWNHFGFSQTMGENMFNHFALPFKNWNVYHCTMLLLLLLAARKSTQNRILPSQRWEFLCVCVCVFFLQFLSVSCFPMFSMRFVPYFSWIWTTKKGTKTIPGPGFEIFVFLGEVPGGKSSINFSEISLQAKWAVTKPPWLLAVYRGLY